MDVIFMLFIAAGYLMEANGYVSLEEIHLSRGFQGQVKRLSHQRQVLR